MQCPDVWDDPLKRKADVVRTPQLTVTDMVKVATWMQENKDNLLNMSQLEVSRQLNAKYGIKLQARQVKEFEQAAGVHRVRGNGTGYRKDRVIMVANELIRLMNELGHSPNEFLVDIVNGK